MSLKKRLNITIFRSRDYESLVELGAKIGVKIRERDEGGGNKAKVQWIIYCTPSTTKVT